jgi:hypothetical protein
VEKELEVAIGDGHALEGGLVRAPGGALDLALVVGRTAGGHDERGHDEQAQDQRGSHDEAL